MSSSTEIRRVKFGVSKKSFQNTAKAQEENDCFFYQNNNLSSAQNNEIIDSRFIEIATTIRLSQTGTVLITLDVVKAGAGTK